MNNSIEKELKSLLYNFWIVKDENKDLYYQIKYNQTKIKDFVAKNLGSNLIIHDRFIKLEKIPTVLKESNGIDKFTDVLDYIILSIFLLFLEDKTRGDKFILSDLIDYIKNTAITLKLDHIPDWNKISDRKSLINTISLLRELNVIKLKDEDKTSFIESKEADALYEVKGISNYVMRLFDSDITDLKTASDFIKNEFNSQDEKRGDIRRYKVFRNILYSSMIAMIDLDSSEIDYIKKNRNYIKSELDKKVNLETEITHNMALVYENEDSNYKDNFPNNKKITEIVLMVNAKILEDINNKVITPLEFESIRVKESYLEQIIRSIKETKAPYIGKTYQKLTFDKFYKEVLKYMQKYNFINKENEDIIIYPLISRMIGKTKDVTNNGEQIDLFGGMDEL